MPRILDAFCGAGGAGMGYHRAGFEVVGIDIEPQPDYPFALIKGDAIRYILDHGHEYDAIHASPPCQLYSVTADYRWRKFLKDLIAPTREALKAVGLPYVIENVPGAPLIDPVQLCGSSFGLRVRRHRLFETSFKYTGRPCSHAWQDEDKIYQAVVSKKRGGLRPTGVVPVFGTGCKVKDESGRPEVEIWQEAMGIDWTGKEGLSQAIPPAFTEHLGRRLLSVLA